MNYDNFKEKYGDKLAIVVFADDLPETVPFNDILIAYCDMNRNSPDKAILAKILEERALTVTDCARLEYTAFDKDQKKRLLEKANTLIESMGLDECAKEFGELKKVVAVNNESQEMLLEKILEKMRQLTRPQKIAA